MTLTKCVVILFGIFLNVSADSCAGRCGQGVNSAYNCQCNAACINYEDCCPDYGAVCLGATCSGRCGQSADLTKPCQCNTLCVSYGDCCNDYSQLCSSGGGSGTPTDPLSDIMNDIWDSDVNRMTSSEIVLSISGNKLFSSVNEAKFALPTFQAFINLLDNFERKIGVAEIVLEYNNQEIETFLDVVMATEAMVLANMFLVRDGKVGPTAAEFRGVLKELWFNHYPRSSSQNFDDSSGFEHVMVGEIRGTSVSGFHSWIQLYLQEKAGALKYNSMVSNTQPHIKAAAFSWFEGSKSKGSFFLGTSPEFDLAVYTICALMHPNARCNFSLQGNSVSIQTYDVSHKAGSQIGTAYPAV